MVSLSPGSFPPMRANAPVPAANAASASRTASARTRERAATTSLPSMPSPSGGVPPFCARRFFAEDSTDAPHLFTSEPSLQIDHAPLLLTLAPAGGGGGRSRPPSCRPAAVGTPDAARQGRPPPDFGPLPSSSAARIRKNIRTAPSSGILVVTLNAPPASSRRPSSNPPFPVPSLPNRRRISTASSIDNRTVTLTIPERIAHPLPNIQMTCYAEYSMSGEGGRKQEKTAILLVGIIFLFSDSFFPVCAHPPQILSLHDAAKAHDMCTQGRYSTGGAA